MKLLSGDRKFQGLAYFPQHEVPSLDSESVRHPFASPLIQPPENPEIIAHKLNITPQKLRPIRCGGRYPASSLGDECFSLTQPQVGSMEEKLGFFEGDMRSGDCFVPPVKVEEPNVGETGTFCGGEFGRQCLVADIPVQDGSGMGVLNYSAANSEEGLLEDESSSSTDNDDSPASIAESMSRKRKRKTREKIENFLENLVMQVLEKQEQMHKELIEMIERRERERIMREEAWRQQELERMKRDEEAQSQETSRNLALISFIQTIIGQEIGTPQPSTIPCMEGNGVKPSQEDIKIDSNSNRRWPEAEVQALIKLRADLEQKFRALGSRGCYIWDEISVGMFNVGYNRTAKKCKEKWENMNKYCKKSSGKKRLENGKTCPYLNELEMLYKTGLVNPGKAAPNHMDNDDQMKD
ncbi:trihelix transcription factor GTL1 [Tripterygium wilfordii]|uniref:Trihelix transcription factor GTL1 n=1 Tax=Tripterygium wilfordii TaxID=458696 RepID=A0A7J7D9B7_TRIWF|nr:trihelix transcription factor GTL1-like [Tripterygium wilfordii]KAF5742839.1 trihelix transcription factor GTL1 [Tripterygium wilfordii]